jgi:hypothetical protein
VHGVRSQPHVHALLPDLRDEVHHRCIGQKVIKNLEMGSFRFLAWNYTDMVVYSHAKLFAALSSVIRHRNLIVASTEE